jgi:hypothetical protein
MKQERLVASQWTSHKQKLFQGFLTAYAAIAAAIQVKWGQWTLPWFYCELTAGSGLNQQR